ncbi:MAG: hypothetical protein DWQ07_01920 [Chloroflexi bacterium]|nr:MAG: hypothetical protein DWQ07_01920 [Chloroflexota bacterium]MBL1193744.1 hypothetical protein [Chloroflexota bacterium]NOH11037.1 hypothetical protein [Chloroflexota bacterium]
MTSSIGTLKESSRHAALKEHFSQPGDEIETQVEGYVIDVKRGNTLIEIQTGSFSNIKAKLNKLLPEYPVRMIYPIAKARWVQRINKKGKQVSRRKSPKKGRVEELFRELLRIPSVATHPNFQLCIAMIHEEVVWVDDGKGSWRRKGWSVADKKLLEVVEIITFERASDYLNLLPTDLEMPFTNKELAVALKMRRDLAQKMTYTLRKMNVLAEMGKRGRSLLFEPTST